MQTLRVLRTKLPLAIFFALAVSTCAQVAQAKEAAPVVEVITTTDVANAITKVKSDPNLAHEQKIRTLRWLNDKDDAPKKRVGWFSWLKDLFGFLAETSRVIVWLAIGVAIALLVVAIIRMLRSVGPSSRAEPFTAPTHVRDLDIRPESLPDDIGAAAFELWERGEHRTALALLYRGLLSRLVHGYEIPIRQSSTEGDCLRLAVQQLAGSRGDYVARVIRVWQRAVYGAQLPANEDVRVICADFANALSKSALGTAS